jgi:hypothetical protein
MPRRVNASSKAVRCRPSHLTASCLHLTMTTRLKHRGHVEEEDAATLRLGSGACKVPSMILDTQQPCRVQQRRLSAHFGGSVPPRESRQGGTGHCVSPTTLASARVSHWSLVKCLQ